jgi:hypothetical protein
MSVLDASLAETILRIWPLLINDCYIATVGRFNEGKDYEDLISLDALGILRLGQGMVLHKFDTNRATVYFKTKSLIFRVQPALKNRIPAGILTRTGQELTSIVPPNEDEAIIREIAPLLMNELRATAVFLANFDRVTKQQSLGTVERLAGIGDL